MGAVTKQIARNPLVTILLNRPAITLSPTGGLKIAADFQKSYPERRTGANNQAASPAGCAESEAVLKRSWQAMQ